MAQRSACARRKIGAVIVTERNRVVATGYNGPPAGLDQTCTEDCPRWKTDGIDPTYDNCISIHAEANALMFCDRKDREGGTIYVNELPCYNCAKLIANSGLTSVAVATLADQEHRPLSEVLMLLANAGIDVLVG
jgi:dCMP deaminase